VKDAEKDAKNENKGQEPPTSLALNKDLTTATVSRSALETLPVPSLSKNLPASTPYQPPTPTLPPSAVSLGKTEAKSQTATDTKATDAKTADAALAAEASDVHVLHRSVRSATPLTPFPLAF
jgi:hypothetical protein